MTAPLLIDADGHFRSMYERTPFLFKHKLAETGLFTIPRMINCAERILASGKEFRFLVREAQDRIDTRFDQPALRSRLASAFANLETSNSWVKLDNVADVDPEYTALLDACIDEIAALSGRDIRRDLTFAQFTVFCSSPGSVTPYHIDHEMNFLCQVAGEKVASVWSPSNRGVLSEAEIEKFYAGEINSAVYRDGMNRPGF